jgi:hypothetical protein
MKRVKAYKGFIIALDQENTHQIFTKNEWSYGDGCRYPEHETITMQEAVEFIDCYF